MLIAISGFAFLLISCEEKSDIDTPAVNTTVSIDDELYTSEVFEEIIEIGDEATDLLDSNSSTLKVGSLDVDGNGGRDTVQGGTNNIRLSECVTIIKEITDSTITTNIDFGEVNCLCNDGRERRGKIIMVHEGKYWDGLVYTTFTFEAFFVDDNQILGEKTVSQFVNEDGFRESEISIDGSLVLADGTGVISFEAEKVRIVVEGSDTRTKLDDVTETTGGSTCVLADGTEKTMTIITALVRTNEEACYKYIVEGIREITETDASTITIDYGDGTCDNLAEVTVDGVTTVIELHRKIGTIN
jgi:hypothetical protein